MRRTELTSLYPEALRALQRLLDACGETRWRDFLAVDLDEWRRDGSVRHHLSAYGAMGSLTDLYLSRLNGHALTAENEAWAQALGDDLRAICYLEARAHGAFLPRRAPDLQRALDPPPAQVTGWRCRTCGHTEVTAADIDRYCARHAVRRAVLDAALARSFDGLVQDVLSGRLPSAADAERQRLAEQARRAGIAVSTREGWMRPCPRCGSAETETWAWRVPQASAPPT